MSLDLKVLISFRILSITWSTTQTSVVRLRPFYSTRRSKWTVLAFAIKLKIRRPRQENHLGEAKKKKLVGQWRTPTKQTELLKTLWHEDSPQTGNPGILPDTPRCVWEKLFPLCSFLNQQKTTLLQSCALVAVTIPVLQSYKKRT